MSDAAQRHSGRFRLPVPAYLGCVALMTALGVGLAMQLRPPFGHAVRQLAGLEMEPRANRDSFYTVRVAPLLESRCGGCHGARMQKAQLRLDSFAALMRGGRHGAVIQPGHIKDSELFTRISLPLSDDKAMPPNGKTPLTADEVTVIRLWIAAGASGVKRVVAGAPAPVREVKLPEIDPRAVQKQRAPLAAVVKQLQARLPGVIDYESRSSADLEVHAALRGASFGDADLAALMPLKDRIVWADFSGTAITDASAPALAAMTSLRTLRLLNTKVTDTTMRALAPLKALRSLTAGTGASEAALASLRQRGVAVYGGGDGH
jgi:hypothetical protein